MPLHPFGNDVLLFRLDQASQRKSNISDGMVFKKNYTNKQIKLKWTAAPSNNVFKILVGIIENYPCGNVCLCRIIMNACNNIIINNNNNNNNNNFISAPYIDLHDTKK